MISLIQIKQCNGYESIKNDEIFNLHLGSGASPKAVSLLPARHQLHPLAPSAQTINQEETKNPQKKIYLQANHIVLPWPTYTDPRV